jgi:protocadherin alpha
VGLYTGEISTTRALDEADAPRQRLLVLVKDHGEPALMATVTVLVSLVDSGQEPKVLRTSVGASSSEAALVNVNVYLIIAICAVSSLLVLTLLLYTALRCSAAPSGSMCGPGKPMLVCSSAVGSWSYTQQRRQRVCSGEVPPKTDLMAFSPSLPPCPVNQDKEDQLVAELDFSDKVSNFSFYSSFTKCPCFNTVVFSFLWKFLKSELHCIMFFVSTFSYHYSCD